MVRYHETLWCDGCGIEISWDPVEKDQLFFCCQNCMIGAKCNCAVEDEEYPPSGQGIQTNYQSTPHH